MSLAGRDNSRSLSKPHQLALGGARRPEQQQVLPADGCQQQEPNLRLSLDESAFDDANRSHDLLSERGYAAVFACRDRAADLRLR